jgi:hypothetical protein
MVRDVSHVDRSFVLNSNSISYILVTAQYSRVRNRLQFLFLTHILGELAHCD